MNKEPAMGMGNARGVWTGLMVGVVGAALSLPGAALGDEPKKSEPAKAPDAAKPAETKAPAKPASREGLPQIQVELLSPGADPKSVLKLAPKKGEQYGVIITRESTTGMDTPMGQEKAAIPPVLTKMLVTAGESTGDKIMYTWELVGVAKQSGVAPDPRGGQIAEMTAEAMNQVKSMKVNVAIGADGRFQQRNIEAPASLPPEAKPLIDSVAEMGDWLGVTLPAEAVGAGAKWRVTAKMYADGMVMTQITNYTLVSNKDGVVAADFDFVQTADKQILETEDTSGVYELQSHSGAGKGRVEFALSRPTISSLSIERNSSTKIVVTGAAQDFNFTQNIVAKESTTTVPADKLAAAGEAATKDAPAPAPAPPAPKPTDK